MSEIDLLPRADLPVIWDAFKAQVEKFRETAETLIVTDVSQKDKMELACRTRLTLRKIRIAVEHKRVELGEGHLKEIQKVNGAARAIREFIEPLEARLLDQETFAERAEEKRIADLATARYLEASAIRPQSPRFVKATLGRMPQEDFDALIESIKQEQAELEEANRLRVEAEKRLVETEAASRAALELAQRVALEEKQRRDAEAEQIRFEQEAKLRNERSVAEAVRTLERVEAEKRRQADLEEYERKAQVAREEAEANARAEATYLRQEQERLRIRDEQIAILEAELAQERAAKQAESDAARKLALAPDLDKLRDFESRLRFIDGPKLSEQLSIDVFLAALGKINEAVVIIQTFVKRNLTAK